jgi:cytochrome c oxidase assembly protein subunit 20
MTDNSRQSPTDPPPKGSFLDAAKVCVLQIEITDCQSVHLQDFKHLHEIPCARPAFLYGISSGFVLAGVHLVLGASMRKATSWAIGSFLGVSVVVFEGCHMQREREKERIRLIQEAMEKRAKEKAREQFLRERALRQMAAEAKEKEEQLKKDRSKWFWQ